MGSNNPNGSLKIGPNDNECVTINHPYLLSNSSPPRPLTGTVTQLGWVTKSIIA